MTVLNWVIISFFAKYISKAFDRVWHKGLLFKLKSVGVSGNILAWFEDYLSDRYQRVCITNSASSWKKISAGVPQGYILGLLFFVFINDIVNEISSFVRQFADDTCVFVWAKTWLVLFNALETEAMNITKTIKIESSAPVY